jgi:DNA transformation protein
MSSSGLEKEYVSYVVDLMQSIGPVYAKAMFGGYGIYLDGVMFALIADQVLFLKVDEQTVNDFKSNGLEAFTYYKKGSEYKMSYHQAPDDTLEDYEVMNLWANRAYAAALRAASGKRKK